MRVLLCAVERAQAAGDRDYSRVHFVRCVEMPGPPVTPVVGFQCEVAGASAREIDNLFAAAAVGGKLGLPCVADLEVTMVGGGEYKRVQSYGLLYVRPFVGFKELIDSGGLVRGNAPGTSPRS